MIDPHGNVHFNFNIVDEITGEVKQYIEVSSMQELMATLAMFPGCKLQEVEEEDG